MPSSCDRDDVLSAMTNRFTEFYDAHGLDLKLVSGQLRSPCPIHQGSGSNWVASPDTGWWECKSAGCKGDVFTFVMKTQGMTFPEALIYVAEWAGISGSDATHPARTPRRQRPTVTPVEKPPVFLDPCLAETAHQALLKNSKMLDWLEQHRGLTLETIQRFQVGMDQHPEDKAASVRRVTFPVYDAQGRLTNIRRHLFAYKNDLTEERRRELGKSKPWQPGLQSDLFPLSTLDGATDVLIVEGEADALLANQMGFAAVTGTSGAGTWKAHWTAALCALQIRRTTALYDGDAAGEDGVQKPAQALSTAGQSVLIARYPEGVKDFTEWVLNHGGTADGLRTIIDAATLVPRAGTTSPAIEPPNNLTQAMNTETAEWESPVSFSAQILPEFPLEALPPVLGDCVASVARRIQVPVDIAGMLAIAAVAAAGARTCIVQIGQTHAEPLNLYVAVVAGPGERKSAAHEALIAPVREAEKEMQDREKPVILAAQEQRAFEDKRVTHLRDEAVKTKDDTKRNELLQTLQETVVSMTDVPVIPRLLADDVTPEELAAMMAGQGGTMALFSAEGGIFSILAGRYSKNGEANLDLFLKSHAGEDYRYDRKGSSSVFLPRACLTIGLAVQPDVLASLADTPAFRGRGLLGRFLYSLPESLVGTRMNDVKPKNDDQVACYNLGRDAEVRYNKAIKTILDISPVDTTDDPAARHVLTISGAALVVWATYANEIEQRQADGEDLAGIRDWASKLAGAVARIAANFHLIDHGPGIPISAETVTAAWAVGMYLIPHAQAAYGQMGADPNHALAIRLLRWIERKHMTRFTLRDCHQAHRGIPSSQGLIPALSLLCERGYLREVFTEPGPKGGRPKGGEYEVNPL